jgi:hypothetical protein
MKKSTTVFGAGLFSILASGALISSALAEEVRPGVDFKPAVAPSASCLVSPSAGVLRNDCPGVQEIVATLPNLPAGPHATSVMLFGTVLSACRSMTIGPQGGGVEVGPLTASPIPGMSWRTIDTGIRNSLFGTVPIVFRCMLESGGMIGSFRAS